MITKLIQKLSSGDMHFGEVLRGASSALVIRTLGTIIGFAVSLAAARLLGAEGAGAYFLAVSVATIAATIGRVGIDDTVVRFVASNASESKWADVQYVYGISIRIVSTVSLISSLGLFFGAEWLANVVFGKSSMETTFRIVALAVFPLSLAMTHAEGLRGLKNVPASQWIKTVAISVVTLVLLYPMIELMQANGAVVAYVVAVIFTTLLSLYLWRVTLNSREKEKTDLLPTVTINDILQSCGPLLVVAMTGIIMQQGATFFLGVWGSIEAVGIYSIANRIASLAQFPLIATISIIAPKFAEIYSQGDLEDLKSLASRSARMLTYLAVPIAVLLSLISDEILKLFGEEFGAGSTVLIILLVGVVVNASTGAVSYILIMSGHEKIVRNTFILSSVFSVIMYVVLIPSLGMIGAAIASCIGVSFHNLMMTWMVRRILGFSPISFNFRANT